MPRRHDQPSTPLSAAEFAALAAYRHALRRFLHFSTDAARSAGFTQQQYQVLLAVKAAPDEKQLSIGELAATMQLRHHSAVGLVDRLARRGCIKRSTDSADRRCVRVQLTAAGNRLLGRLASVHRSELRRLGPELVRALQSLGIK